MPVSDVSKVIKETVFKYSTPFTIISESKQDSKSRKVRGIALKARTSRNNVTYMIDEIDKAKTSLIGRNLKVNHSEDVTNNVGKITNAYMDGDNLVYEAEIFNTSKFPDIVDMVQNGLIQHVSIEAIAKEVMREGDMMKAMGLEFTGLGLVDTPGIPEASVALAEAFKKMENQISVSNVETIKEEKNMVEVKEDMKACVDGMMEKGMDKDAAMEKCQQMMDKEEKKPEIKEEVKIDESKKLREDLELVKEELRKIKETPISKGKALVEKPKTLKLVTERHGNEISVYSEDFLY